VSNVDNDERELDDNEQMLLLNARDAIAAIKIDKKIQRVRVDPIWRAIASGLLNDEDTANWARCVARSVVRDVLDDKSQDRDDRALKALGIYGQGQSDDRTESELEAALTLERLAGAQARLHGKVQEPVTKAERHRNLVRSLRAAGCYRGVPDQAALKRLRRLLQKRPRAS
jgi:hypothetical protein